MNELHLYRSLSRSEKWYSLAIVWIPVLVTIYSIASGMLFNIHLGTLVLLLICYSCTVLGVTVGFHRLLTHHSFKANRWLKIVLTCFGCMAYEGTPFFWIAAHRRHHKYTETEFDPHSPIPEKTKSLYGLYYAHMGWMSQHTLENWRYYIGDLLLDRDLRFINKHYTLIAFSGLIIPGGINGLMYRDWYSFFEGIIVCGFFRVFSNNMSPGPSIQFVIFGVKKTLIHRITVKITGFLLSLHTVRVGIMDIMRFQAQQNMD